MLALGIFECLLPKAQQINILNFLDSFKIYGKLLENPKTVCCKELFLPENDSQDF